MAAAVSIELASGTALEEAGEAQLYRILARYDLQSLIFTRRVRIESRVIPHSHPVLTLNTRHLDDDELQLATFLHEQVHWFCSEKEEAVDAAIADLKLLYPEVPVGAPQGARDKYSVYLHLIVNLLELDALERLLGQKKAKAVIARKDYYLWIYDKVLQERAKIRPVLREHGLELPRS
ncbi:hypothetical protein [Pelagibius sp. Alg239-R121]|uniref:hypothetical protein n=1 Tax=Pelagibius sp. Alg239-R121 TaxID=2993448 RepID=UPI0024A78320|nr:hypothetical protein [Pelagibius sp. Alg239-R121]